MSNTFLNVQSDIQRYITRTVPAKKIKFLSMFIIYVYTSSKLYTYESCVNKIIFLFNNFCSLFILFVIVFIVKNENLKK